MTHLSCFELKIHSCATLILQALMLVVTLNIDLPHYCWDAFYITMDPPIWRFWADTVFKITILPVNGALLCQENKPFIKKDLCGSIYHVEILESKI